MTQPVLTPKLQKLAKKIVNPEGVFEGRRHGAICEVDNVLIFNRLTRTDLQQKSLQNMHHRHVLFFNLGTAGVLSLDGVQIDLNPGEALMVLPYQFHSFPMVEQDEITWVMVSFESSNAESLEIFRNKSFQVSADCFELLGQVIEDFSTAESKFLNVAYSLKVSLLLNSFSEQLSLQQEISVPSRNGANSQSAQLVAQIEKVLLSADAEMTSVDDIAKELDVSASHLRATFRGYFNISLGSFIRHFRLNQATDMLANSQASLTAIAAAIGFSSPSTFTRFFRNSLGMTPKDYRNAARKR